MRTTLCAANECDGPAHAKGLCRHHYYRQSKGLPLEGGRRQPRAPLDERVERYFERGDGCWEWTGARTAEGRYGAIRGASGVLLAHRAVWGVLVGPIPSGAVIDHDCRNGLCVNPAHLRVTTQEVNVTHNSLSPAALNARRTYCKRGHELTEDNVYRPPSRPHHRQCRACRAVYNERRRRHG